MSGGGIGGTLGGLLGAALAPETGGLSLAIPAITGAAGAAAGGALTGDKNILKDALMGGITSGLGAGFNSLTGDATGIAGSLNGDLPSWLGGASSATNNLIPNAIDGVSGTGTDLGLSLGNAGTGAASTFGPDVSSQFLQAAGGAGNSAATGAATSAAMQGAVGAGTPSIFSNITQWAAKNPLQAAILGNSALTGIQGLIPKKQVNVAQNRANVLASDPNFSNPNLPAYHMQNTATPYSGNWYTYGETPQTPLYNGQLVPGYARGGRVKGYAAGGPMMPPQGMPPLAAPQPSMQQGPVNPLMVKAAHNIGVAIGKHIKGNKMNPLTPPGQVNGPGGGQDDAVPAKLSDGEYIVPSETVSQLGDGSTTAGAKKLDGMVHKIRMHKTGKSSFPPRAKNPLAYIKKAKV